MKGHFIDIYRTRFRKASFQANQHVKFMDTSFGRIRVFDTESTKPAIISVPDGPNVIEHHEHLIGKLSSRFRVICFEFPGFGFSHPDWAYDYSLDTSANLILELMDTLKVEQASLSFSCSNGFYAIRAAEIAPEKFAHLFLAQTPSLHSMKCWANNTIPKALTIPVLGEFVNMLLEKKMANSWYKYALPKDSEVRDYQIKAVKAIKTGGCFCLSGLVQGLDNDLNSKLLALNVPSTLVWGTSDFTHRNTDSKSVLKHLPNCEIIEFKNCGHFPELENTENFVKLVHERVG